MSNLAATKIKYPLTAKIATALIFIILVVIGSFAYYEISENREEMEVYEKKNNFSSFTSAIPVLENALWEIDFKTINSTLNQLMKNPNVISASLFSEQGYSISYLVRGTKKEPLNVVIEDLIPKEEKEKLFKIEYNNKNSILLQIDDRKNEKFILAYPLFFKNSKKEKYANLKVGYLVMTYSTKHISLASKELLIKYTILFSILGIVLVITSFLVVNNLIISPIKELERASLEIANNRLFETEFKNRFFGNDEIESLKVNFNFMVKQIIQLIKDEKEQQRMANELETTKIVQKSFIPKANNLRVSYFEISAFFQSASECGGDWWHFYPLSNKRILIMLGDVTGHGTPSAMLTAAVKGYCDSLYSRDINEPSTILEELDVIVRSIGGEERMMTMFSAIIDPLKQKLLYSNAAQNFPFLINKDSNTSSPSTLLGNGKRLGYISPDNSNKQHPFKVHTIDFKVDNIIFLYSDGLTEAKNSNKREYSERRLMKKLKSINTLNTNDIVNTIQLDLIEFTQGNRFEDDVTFVACKFCATEAAGYSNEIIKYFSERNQPSADAQLEKVS
ncbi:SpoIIE family protein phosphatase [Pigmentibacter ruber]|uniref:SpoIIE family protein phosphatase n=1 Tax=Pigmentibacter ruber TaxID=2683196 RepID=UPI00131DF4BF|nr:SpoIIE family protein phosphatase [Pigmentibacter ruber]